jgi:ketosteroid isomerase-like protein
VKAGFLSGGRANRWLVVAAVALVLTVSSVMLGACSSGGGDEQALMDKMTAAWTDNDVAAAKELYTADAVIRWPEGADPARTTGIEEISKAVADYPVDPTPMGDEIFIYEPSAKDIEALSVAYEGAQYIAGPVRVGRDLYHVVVEVRDGRIANQWVDYMYRY